MWKLFTFLLVVALTGAISEPEARPQAGIETTSVTLVKKVAMTRPFFRLEKGIERMVEVTAYSSKPGDLTFSETEPEWGTVAVDPEVIPLGSIILFPDIFPGFKFLAVDTGRKIVGWKIDLWLPVKDFADFFGVQKMRVIIQKPS